MMASSGFNDLFLIFVLVSTVAWLKKVYRYLGEARKRASVISAIKQLLRK